jgi:hypothetical protein
MLTEALILAEKVHLALVKLSRGSSVFTGCDSSRRPLQGNGHAYILCEPDRSRAREGGRKITHVTVYAPMGFGPQEQKALEALEEVWGSCKIEFTFFCRAWAGRRTSAGLNLAAALCWPGAEPGYL